MLRPYRFTNEKFRETTFSASIVFMGTPEFAVPSLQVLLREQYPVLAVVTAAEKPRGRGRLVSSTAVSECAAKHGLPLLQPESLRSPEFITRLRDLQPDILIVVAFRILPPEVFRIPRIASFNLHASMLPAYRGAAPINRAIMNGETVTGLTTFVLADKVDTGGIILQQSIPINQDDNAGSLHDRLSVEGSRMVLATVRLLEAGKAKPVPQNDSLATPAPKIRKEDCRIDWNRPAIAIHNQIRGLSPHPAAFTVHRGKILKIYKSTPTMVASAGTPGTIYAGKDFLQIATADFLLSIEEIQLEGKRRMGMSEFLRGYEIGNGEEIG